MICVNCTALKAENATLRDDIAKLSGEYEREMRVIAAAKNLKVASNLEDIKDGDQFWVLRCQDYEELKKAIEALKAARSADE